MTEKQLRYIIAICPQTIDCEEYVIKPENMQRCLSKLPQDITQNLIDYGKAWKRWCYFGSTRSSDIINELIEESERKKAWKEMRRLEKIIANQLREGKYQIGFDRCLEENK